MKGFVHFSEKLHKKGGEMSLFNAPTFKAVSVGSGVAPVCSSCSWAFAFAFDRERSEGLNCV